MMHINYSGEITDAKEQLLKSMGNFPKIVDILKKTSDSDEVDILFYIEANNHLADKIKGNITQAEFLNEQTHSVLAKAYCNATPYYCSHTLYDKYFNVAIDDPYRVNISTQIVIPISVDDKVVGVIRFSKFKGMFERFILKKLMELENEFVYIFNREVNRKIKEVNQDYFSLGSDELYNIIDVVKTGIERLSSHTHNPEIQKLLYRAEENLESLCEYLNPTEYVEKIAKESKDLVAKQDSDEYRHYHILLADDVEMNVRILNAMIKSDKHYDISFAYDGIDALAKIDEAREKNNSINILFLDHYMPGKLGLEVAQMLRESEKIHGDKKITIVSITNDPKAIESQKHLYDYHIGKPFVKSDIIEVLDKIQHHTN